MAGQERAQATRVPVICLLWPSQIARSPCCSARWSLATGDCQVTLGSTVLEGFGGWGHWLLFHPGHSCNLKMPSSFSSPLPSSVLQIQQVLPMGRHCPRPELWPLPRLMLWSWLAVACPQVPVGWADLGAHFHWLYSQASLQDHM